MTIRRSGRLLLCSVALAAAGCSSDSMRFSDMYPNGSTGVDTRAVGSIGGPSLAANGAPDGAPVPGANVAPRGPAGWLSQQTRNPLLYGRAGGHSSTSGVPGNGLDSGATGSLPAQTGLGVGSSHRGVTQAALPPVTPAPGTVLEGVVGRSVQEPTSAVVAAATGPRSVLEKARAALPSMPQRARLPGPANPTPLAVRVAEAKSSVGWSGEGGRVTVGEGQTLYNLSKRFGVPVAAIMAANGISDPTTVKIGQTLVIPRYTYGSTATVSAPDADPNVRAATAGRGMIGEVSPGQVPPPGARTPYQTASAGTMMAPTQPARSAFSATRTVTVGSGDTLYSIAQRTGTSVEALRDANALAGDAIRIGQVLSLPGGIGTVASSEPVRTQPAQQVALQRPTQVEPVVTKPVPVAVETAREEPKDLPRTNPPVLDTIETASIPAAAPVAASQSTGAMRRPADGRIIRRFGGAQKGIDIAVPSGTPVRAAENGTVIYAGSGLKEFGKTVLIQHADGLVTVYGHADTLNVAKGQKVSRGDVIASSGMSGEAETPRVHFQVRKGSTPVDPEAFL